MVSALFLIFLIAVHILLAVVTARDADTRGQDSAFWFVASLLFGVLSILIYLITRKDERLPESDRPDRTFTDRLWVFIQYAVVSVFGFAIMALIANGFLDIMYPVVLGDECYTVYIGHKLGLECGVTEARFYRVKTIQSWVGNSSGVLGLATSIYGLYSYRQSE